MRLLLFRFSGRADSTLGLLFVNGIFECFILEDEFREIKVPGETRIPAGQYRVGLRTEGGFHQRYSKRYSRLHKGMLEVLEVPNFKWILFHSGNTEKHTDGCLLTADRATSNVRDEAGRVDLSRAAYERLYRKVISAMDAGESVFLEVRDEPWGRGEAA